VPSTVSVQDFSLAFVIIAQDQIKWKDHS